MSSSIFIYYFIVTTPCIQNPCNGGGCQYHAGSYICTCPPELTGEFCEESSKLNIMHNISFKVISRYD